MTKLSVWKFFCKHCSSLHTVVDTCTALDPQGTIYYTLETVTKEREWSYQGPSSTLEYLVSAFVEDIKDTPQVHEFLQRLPAWLSVGHGAKLELPVSSTQTGHVYLIKEHNPIVHAALPNPTFTLCRMVIPASPRNCLEAMKVLNHLPPKTPPGPGDLLSTHLSWEEANDALKAKAEESKKQDPDLSDFFAITGEPLPNGMKGGIILTRHELLCCYIRRNPGTIECGDAP